MSLATFIGALQATGMQPTGLEIAEALWLVQHLDSSSAFPAESRQLQQTTQTGDPGTGDQEPSPSSSSDERVQLNTAKAGAEGPQVRGHPVEIPGIPGLRQRKEIQRALRPLRRYGAAPRRRVIDEDATATFIAETGLWTPVMRPVRERWFDLALAIDSSPSMSLWQPLIADLRTVLSETGAFRDIRTWEFTQRRRSIVLRPHGRDTGRSPRELIDGSGRRLFLIVTDGAATGWHDGLAVRTLADWGKSGPVAILQLLPEHMWSRTGVPPGAALITAPAPGSPNSQLRVERRRRRIPGISIPVLGIEPDALRAWARLVAGSGSAVRLAVTSAAGRRRAPTPLADPGGPVTTVERFRAAASPDAYQLAVCLSAVPLTLPIMRLVQHFVAPASPTSALAEVILGGLISRTGESSYEFLPGVRETLLRELHRSELIAVFAAVSDYIARNAGRATHTFPAIAEYREGSVAVQAQAFSWVPHTVAARLGLPVISSQAESGSETSWLRNLGADPATGKPMAVIGGGFGPYLTDGLIVVPLPKDQVALLSSSGASALLAEFRSAQQGVRVVLVGPPGAGKGTQAHYIAAHLGVPRVSTGDIFRYNVAQRTELGLKAVEHMDRGDLVPDEITVAMVRERLVEADARTGFLLDGFPRNTAQAETLKKMLAEMDARLTVVLELIVDEMEIVRRLSGRRTCRRCQRVWHVLYEPPSEPGVCDDCGGELFQRDDDKEEVIRHRLEVYNDQTSPLIAFYADDGDLIGIDAAGTVEEVTARGLSALAPYVQLRR